MSYRSQELAVAYNKLSWAIDDLKGAIAVGETSEKIAELKYDLANAEEVYGALQDDIAYWAEYRGSTACAD